MNVVLSRPQAWLNKTDLCAEEKPQLYPALSLSLSLSLSDSDFVWAVSITLGNLKTLVALFFYHFRAPLLLGVKKVCLILTQNMKKEVSDGV